MNYAFYTFENTEFIPKTVDFYCKNNMFSPFTFQIPNQHTLYCILGLVKSHQPIKTNRFN